MGGRSADRVGWRSDFLSAIAGRVGSGQCFANFSNDRQLFISRSKFVFFHRICLLSFTIIFRNSLENILIFLNTIFVSSHMYPENPEGTQVIVGSMNMGYISDTARNRTHNLFRPKREPIPLGHSDGSLWPSDLSVVSQDSQIENNYNSQPFWILRLNIFNFSDCARWRSRLVILVNISPTDCFAFGVDAPDGFRFIIVFEGRPRPAKAAPAGRRSTADGRLILAGEDGSTDIGRES